MMVAPIRDEALLQFLVSSHTNDYKSFEISISTGKSAKYTLL